MRISEGPMNGFASCDQPQYWTWSARLRNSNHAYQKEKFRETLEVALCSVLSLLVTFKDQWPVDYHLPTLHHTEIRMPLQQERMSGFISIFAEVVPWIPLEVRITSRVSQK